MSAENNNNKRELENGEYPHRKVFILSPKRYPCKINPKKEGNNFRARWPGKCVPFLFNTLSAKIDSLAINSAKINRILFFTRLLYTSTHR